MTSGEPQAGNLWPFARPLYDIANTLESATGSEARLRRVLEIVRQIVPYDRCALLEAQPGLERRLILAPEPEPHREQQAMLDLLGKLLGLLSEQPQKLPGFALDVPLKTWDAHLAVPLVGLDQVIGVLFVGRHGQPYDERDLGFLSVVAAQTAAYLTTLRLQQEERRAREEAERANREKDEFVAMISHELRMPLTAILGWAQMLGTGVISETDRDRAIEVITRSAVAQSRLIEDLLDLSRITTGKLRLDLRPVDLGAVVLAAVEAARPLAAGKSLALEGTRDPETMEVLGDPDRLQQVVSNLLGNAIKFTPSGGRIAVRAVRGATEVRIQVSDTGKGISPEILPTIFARFRQADHASRRGQDGLGLGLAIVQSLVALHGGQVHAESHGEGAGSIFTVVLPRARSEALPGGLEVGSR